MTFIGNWQEHRAKTPQEREEIADWLLNYWEDTEPLRLGQLISNALLKNYTDADYEPSAADLQHLLFYVEDRVLLDLIRKYVENR